MTRPMRRGASVGAHTNGDLKGFNKDYDREKGVFNLISVDRLA